MPLKTHSTRFFPTNIFFLSSLLSLSQIHPCIDFSCDRNKSTKLKIKIKIQFSHELFGRCCYMSPYCFNSVSRLSAWLEICPRLFNGFRGTESVGLATLKLLNAYSFAWLGPTFVQKKSRTQFPKGPISDFLLLHHTKPIFDVGRTKQQNEKGTGVHCTCKRNN